MPAYSWIRPLARFALASGAAVLVLGLAGCSDDPESGSLTVFYKFGGLSRSCEQEGVTDVRVTLDGEIEETAPCDTVNGIELTDVPARNYRSLLVEGLANDGVAIRDNLGKEDLHDENVEVLGGRDVEIDSTLTPTPAQVLFTFILVKPTGVPYGPQEEVPIASFHVTAWEDGGNNALASHDFVYGNLKSVSDLRMPDPDRSIKGDEVNAITVDIRDRANARVSDALAFEFDPPGAGRAIDIRISCKGEDCSGSEIVGAGRAPGESDTDE